MQSIRKKLVYIMLFGAINFGICSILWIPSQFLDVVRGAVFIGLTLWSIYLIYRVIRDSHKTLSTKHPKHSAHTRTTFIALGLVSAFVIVNFINFILFVSSGLYLNEYEFENKKFYVHDTSFIMGSMCEISVKVDYLPIRKKIVSFEEVAVEDIRLYRDKNMVYFLTDEKKHDLYDLNTSSSVVVWG